MALYIFLGLDMRIDSEKNQMVEIATKSQCFPQPKPQYLRIIIKIFKSRMSSIMRKWEEDTIKKNHRKKLDNAKAVLNTTSKSINSDRNKYRKQQPNSHSRGPPTRSQFAHTSTTHQVIESSPLYNLLQSFQLEKYARALVSRGFGYDLGRFRLLDEAAKEDLITAIHVDQPEHRTKLYTLINFISILMDKMTTDSSALNKHNQPLPEIQAKKPLKQNMIRKKDKSESMHQIMRRSRQRNNISQEANTNNQADQPKNFLELNKQNIRRKPVESKTKPKRPPFDLSPGPYSVKSSDKYSQSKLSTASSHPQRKSLFRFADDACIVHRYINGVQEVSLQPNRLLMNIQFKLAAKAKQRMKSYDKRDNNYLNGASKNKIQEYLNIDLEVSAIKGMYLSFDSATLTSNIVNLDLEQLVNCFSKQIHQRLVTSYRMRSQERISNPHHEYSTEFEDRDSQDKAAPSTSPPNSCQSKPLPAPAISSFEDRLQVVQEIGNSDDGFSSMLQSNKKNIEDILKVSLAYVEDAEEDESEQTCGREQDEAGGSECESSFVLEDSETDFQEMQPIPNLRNKLKSFDPKQLAEISQQDHRILYQEQPSFAVIVDYLKNIIISTKMEKEAPIIALVYLNRLVDYCGKIQSGLIIFTLYNWRNLVLIALLLASKIWDDTSLQNHSVAKVLVSYTTLQLNHMEKVYLDIIGYRLCVEIEEYTKAYFQLRKHAGPGVPKTASLKPLTREEVKKLESRTNEIERKLKAKHKQGDGRKSV